MTKVILCEFDGQLYKCMGTNKEEQENCLYFEPSDKTNRCFHCKNDSFEFLCDCDEVKKVIGKK